MVLNSSTTAYGSQESRRQERLRTEEAERQRLLEEQREEAERQERLGEAGRCHARLQGDAAGVAQRTTKPSGTLKLEVFVTSSLVPK